MGRQMSYCTLPHHHRPEGRPTLARDRRSSTRDAGERTAGLALTEWAVKHGAMRLEWQEHRYDNDYLHALIRHWVFEISPGGT